MEEASDLLLQISLLFLISTEIFFLIFFKLFFKYLYNKKLFKILNVFSLNLLKNLNIYNIFFANLNDSNF